jgi:NAD(P)-dependent dehydrogenase (short-subunit alcohol dehydrogenase family)
MKMQQNVPDMHGKVCLITGGTSGIGLITAEALTQAGATVIIVGRSPEKTQSAVRAIQEKAGSQNVEYLLGDLSNQAEVRRMAADFHQRHHQLHVLINNAGAVFMSRRLSQDGIEITFALNHLAYFLLTNLLLDLLIASAPSRIINVSSAAHTSQQINLSDLQNQQKYNSWKAYGQSKLANLYFTYQLARRLDGTGVTVNALHPGFVATNFGRSNGGLFNPIFKLAQLAAISPEEGAKTSIYLATSPDVNGVTGKYFVKSKLVSSSPVSYDENIARKLWEISQEMTGLLEKA